MMHLGGNNPISLHDITAAGLLPRTPEYRAVPRWELECLRLRQLGNNDEAIWYVLLPSDIQLACGATAVDCPALT